MNPYPKLYSETFPDIVRVMEVIVRERPTDIKDFDNLNNRFMSGRIVGKIPTGAADISPSDRVGDTNFDYATGYMYRVVDNSGTAVWARVPIETSW
jgi:hypothetical protein